MGEAEGKGDDGEGDALLGEEGWKKRWERTSVRAGGEENNQKEGRRKEVKENNLSMRENEESVRNKSAAVKVKESKAVYL